MAIIKNFREMKVIPYHVYAVGSQEHLFLLSVEDNILFFTLRLPVGSLVFQSVDCYKQAIWMWKEYLCMK